MDTHKCNDCSSAIQTDEEELVMDDPVWLCSTCYQTRFEKNKFDDMPTNLNFSRKPLKLTIHKRPVCWGVRVYEQAQEGLVSYGERR